jgi:thiamine-phosphate pyrophosphorylase
MKKYISKFHYLSQDLVHRTHIEQVEIACIAGANWIQYRCLTKNDEDLIQEIHQIASICDDWGATLILTNHYHLLDQVDAQGVHLEDMNADFEAIREIISDEKTLGASANTLEDIQRVYASGVVDYIGCGPFAFTKTKANDYPLLGFEGYQEIVQKMQELQINIPLIGVGGIKLEDTEDLLNTGIDGLAVSAAVNLAENPGTIIKDFYKKIY